jgi:hypothetical protein
MSSTRWDFAMQIKGVTLDTLDMARVAEYLKEWAGLMGDQAKPKFAGVVKGSVVLRARQGGDHKAVVRHRLKQAAANDDAPGRDHFDRIVRLLGADGARAAVIDSAKVVVIEFPTVQRRPSPAREQIVNDSAEIDGIVVAVEGIDETAHLRIQDTRGKVVSMQIRDMSLAREAAGHFRGDPIRVRVHGTWRRSPEGEWAPLSLHVDRVETLDQATVAELMQRLRAIPGNGWAQMDASQAQALSDEIRGRD